MRSTVGTTSRIRGDGVALVWIGAAFALAAAAGVSVCPFATLTGMPCPGCGMLRATLALLGGHWAASFHLHPLAPVGVPMAILAFARTRCRTAPSRRANAIFVGSAGVLVVALLVVWIARFGGALGGPVAVSSIFGAAGVTR